MYQSACSCIFDARPNQQHSLTPEMNREIASAPEKSEASFCAQRTAAVSQPSGRTMRTFSWLVVGTCAWSGVGEAGEDGSADWCRCTERVYTRAVRRAARLPALFTSSNNPTMAERPGNRRSVEHFCYTRKLTKFLTQKIPNRNSQSQSKPEGRKININDFSVMYWYRSGSRGG